MALKIVTGGTTGAADGTLVSSGNPLVIVALNTPVDAHMRCDDGYWSDDQDFDVPAELEVSFDGGSTWYDNGDEPITAPEIEDVNFPIKVRQTTSAGSTSGSFVTDGTYELLPLGDVTGFAASVSGTTVNLSWDAVDGADHYVIEWGTDGVTYGNTLADQSGTSYAHTGRSANTVYHYRIKAYNAAETAGSDGYDTCYAGVQILITAASTRELRGFNATWSTARAGTGTNSVIATDASEEGANCQEGGGYYIDRQYCDFTTTTVVPAGCTIDQAWLRLTHTYVAFSSTGSAICKGTYSSTPPAASDFAAVTLTDLGGPTSNPSANTPTDYAITSPNSNIAKNGTAHLVVMDRQKDYANSAPGSGAISGNNLGGKGNATSDRRPQLKVSFHG